MKTRSLFLAVALACGLVSSSYAQAIVGAWTFGDPSNTGDGFGVVVFLSNNYYFQAERAASDAGPSGYTGMEMGTYSWNSGTSAFSSSTLVDTNGDVGLSSMYSGATFSVSGNVLTVTDADGVGTGSESVDRVTGASALVGGWSVGSAAVTSEGFATVVFLSNGYYFHAERAGSDAGETGFTGMEMGTYTWNSGTGAFSATPVIDNNGDIGLSSLYSGATISVSGNTFTMTDADGPGTGSEFVDRVTPVPEPSTWALMLSGGAFAGMAAWRRRKAAA